MRIGVIEYCLNCGDDIGEAVFPHYCSYCLGVLRSTGKLPGGAVIQESLDEGGDDDTFI